ncbi:hypothetical protein Bca101_065709 [Brassica carinata]
MYYKNFSRPKMIFMAGAMFHCFSISYQQNKILGREIRSNNLAEGKRRPLRFECEKTGEEFLQWICAFQQQ